MAAPHENARAMRFLTPALSYATQRGWRVFRLFPDTKKPFRNTNGFLDATRDEQQIRALWTEEPRANIGIATGKGLIVLDLDIYKEDFDTTAVQKWRLPPTLTVISARGGQHLLYNYPTKLPCVTENQLAQGVCVKADGGYVVAPPSTFQGKPYRFEDDAQPIAELPERIAQMIRAGRPSRVESAKSTRGPVIAKAGDAQFWLDKALSKSGMGIGDATGYWLAQMLFVNEVSDARSTLMDYADRATLNASDPFTERDVARWIRSARESDIVKRGEPSRSVASLANAAQKFTKPITDISQPEIAADETPEEEPAESAEDASDDELLKFSADDDGNAASMWRLYGREFLYVPAYGWMQWCDTHWQMIPPEIVMQYVIKTLKRRRHAAVDREVESIIKVTVCSHKQVNACMGLFRAYVIEKDVSVFDRSPDELNCQNGVLNLKTGNVTPHDSKQRFTYCVPVAYDPRADKSIWEAFVFDAVGQNVEVARYLQACAGYSFTGHTSEEHVVSLYGPTRAGKGTFSESLLALMGKPLGVEIDFTAFTANRDNDSQNFDLAELKPARIVFASESNAHQQLNPAKVKQMSGGNDIRCAFKHKDMFSYRPQFTVWLVSNHQLLADPGDDALWGRLHVIEFPHSHLGAEDKQMKARMRTPANLAGVLRWVVEGAQRWYRDGELHAPDAVVAATTAQREDQDYIKHWLDDRCELNAEAWTTNANLVTSYQNWCEANGQKPTRSTDVADALIKRFGCTRERHGKDRTRGFKGVQLRSSDEPNENWWTGK